MSCQTTPVEKLGQFTRDKSGHRDVFVQQNRLETFRTPRQGSGAQEFASFSRPAPQVRGEFWEAPRIGEQAQPNHSKEWAQQFSSLNITPQIHDPHTYQPHHPLQNQANIPMSGYQQPLNYFPNTYQPQNFVSQQQLLQPQASSTSFYQAGPSKVDTDFEVAFNAVEQRIDTINQQLQPHEEQTQHEEDLSEVARQVLDTVEKTSASESVAEKMKNSQFMQLMGQFSAKSAQVKHNSIVMGEAQAPSTFNGPQVREARIPEPLYKPSEDPPRSLGNGVAHATEDCERFAPEQDTLDESAGDLKDPKLGQQPLENPEEYLKRLAEQKDGQSFMSPFDEANNLGPSRIAVSEWEEDYDSWLRQP